jgi:hypothetical protein
MFVDNNANSMSDYAQNGNPIWYGPGFVDSNNNGMSDHWENSGRGHGGMMEGSQN